MGDVGRRARPKKKHRHRWRDTKGRQRKQSFHTARHKDAFAREAEDLKHRGIDIKLPRSAQASGLLDMMDAYLRETSRTKMKRTTQNRREALTLFFGWLAVRVGHEELGADVLSRRVCQDYDVHLATHGHRKRNSVNSRRIAAGIIYGFWRWAAEQDEYDGLVPMPKRIALPAPTFATVHAPTFDQVDVMISLLRDEVIRRAAVIQRCTGLRIWQVCRLEVEDWDVVRDVLVIQGKLGKSGREKKGRDLPMPPALREEMLTWRLRTGCIITRSVSQVRRAIREAWKASGVPAVYWRLRPSHALRKAFTTEMRARKCESDAVEFWCGRRMGGQADDYADARCLELVQIAERVPPLARCAQGAPLMRMLFAPDRMEAA